LKERVQKRLITGGIIVQCDSKHLKVNAGVIKRYLIDMICRKLDIEETLIDENEPFFTLGITSLISEEIYNSLCLYFRSLSPTILFEYPNIQSLSTHLSKIDISTQLCEKLYSKLRDKKDSIGEVKHKFEQTKILQASENSNRDKVAVIGISGRFPDADNPYDLYKNLLSKKDSIKEIPKSRWLSEQFYSLEISDELKIQSTWGGFIDGIDKFDPYFFKIAPNEADLMDPHQKLFLECSWEAMEDAGYGKAENRPTDNIGVYAGVTWNEFSLLAHEYGYLENSYKGPGSLYWGIPNRTSFFFNFKGPSISIDTACSSSLTAIHLACNALLNDDCEMAVAGGVNLNLHPAKYIFLSKCNFLSTDGKCRSFGTGGDGYVPGEGIGVAVLKPLWRAIEDNDRIHAVISGTSVSHGGKVTGYTVPNPASHKDVILKAIKRANINANQVSYVECHGTGTELGDPIEITGLKMVFGHRKSKKKYCGIGSIKSNIGHLEAAAGIAGLFKVILSMQYNKLPATLHCEEENPKINIQESPFYLLKENKKWKNDPHETVYAGVSSFGAGGSNAHCIVESFSSGIDSAKQDSITVGTDELICLSAKNKDTLRAYAKRLLAFLLKSAIPGEPKSDYKIENIAFTLFKRETFNKRLAMIAKNTKDLTKCLKAYIRQEISAEKTCYTGEIEGFGNGRWIELSMEQLTVKNLKSLSAEWVKGAFDHIVLKSQDRKIVFLPAYPFSKERSWLVNKSPLYSKIGMPLFRSNAQPFIDRNESGIDKGRFIKTFDKSAYVLRDHLVDANHVLPGVCHLEMAIAAGESYLNRKVYEIRDVWFTHMINLIDKDQSTVCINIEPNGSGYKFSIEDVAEKKNVYSSGYLDLNGNLLEHMFPLHEVKERCRSNMPVEKVYDTFRDIRIIQKDSFRVIKAFAMGKEEAWTKLELPRSLTSEFDKHVLHPVLMDGAVQTAMLHYVRLDQRKHMIVPFSFKKLKILNHLTTKMYAYSKVNDLKNKDFTIQLINKQGHIAVEIEHFLLQNYKKKESSKWQLNYFRPRKKKLPVKYERKNTMSSLLLVTNNEFWGKQVRQSGAVDNFKEIIFNCADTALGDERQNTGNDIDEYEMLYCKIKDIINAGSIETRIVFFRDRCRCDRVGLPDNQRVDKFVETELKFVFNFAKLVANTASPIRFILMYTFSRENQDPLKNAMSAFFRAINYENSNLKFKLLFIHSEVEQKKWINIIQSEFDTEERFHEVSYENDDSKILKYYDSVSKGSIVKERGVRFDDEGCYLISGGMGGISKIIVKYLLEKFSANIILTGRSFYDGTFINNHFNLMQNDTRLTYCQADITNPNEMLKLKNCINHKFDRLDGIIHCAGLIDDGFLIHKEWKSFREVLGPKLFGTVNLDNLSDNYDLQFFILFSSITSIFGNIAQSDYAYANGFLDQFAFNRKQLKNEGKKKGETIVINWPYWENGGMQLEAKSSELYERTFRTLPLTNEQGIFALTEAMQYSLEQLIVMNGKKTVIENALNLSNQNLASTNTVNDTGIDMITTASSQNVRSNFVKEFILSLFADVLNLDMDKIDTEASFEEYGLDSIIMIDMIRMLEKTKRFNDIPNTIFIENNTIEKVIRYFKNNYGNADYSLIHMN
jgi:polyketide synthase PksM